MICIVFKLKYTHQYKSSASSSFHPTHAHLTCATLVVSVWRDVTLLNASYLHPQRQQGKQNNSISVTRFSATMQRNIERARAVVTVPKPIIIIRLCHCEQSRQLRTRKSFNPPIRFTKLVLNMHTCVVCERFVIMKRMVWIIIPVLQTRFQKVFAERSHCASPSVSTITGQIRAIVLENGAHEAHQESATEVPLVEKVQQLVNFKEFQAARIAQARPTAHGGGDKTRGCGESDAGLNVIVVLP